MSLSVWQLVLVALLFILLFGRGRIPALMGDLAQGIKSFKRGISEDESQDSQAVEKTSDETLEKKSSTL
jgi:sec-independent protein translocase protein TatA|tara:strand:+ start:747 stop:953 length:207 start_codon:yes stop_codon:yes gene_type:complete